ncbi:MAG TPA: glycoside hydrolase family 15 protein [Vicinamibacterales bacterium]|nr:glycoside hydrolase family 15 protein [Vicinamibacterales bacterium]
MDQRYRPIRDYAVIGDCRTAALVSTAGSVDWLCLPGFDGPSVCGAILDDERGGRFSVRPTGPAGGVSRRYLPGTAVLQTTFTTGEGRACLTDAMSVAGTAASLRPGHELVRRIEALEGEVEVEVLFDPRPAFGGGVARVRRSGGLGFLCDWGSEAIFIRSEIPLRADDGRGLHGTERLVAGERRFITLGYERQLPSVMPPLGADADRGIESSAAWWRDWSRHLTYDGPYRESVLRSAVTLKLMTFAPSGAVVAAPTTSLPEAIGGGRNWDYRYCWLRDASLTLRALFDVGFHAEAEAFLSWMLHATRLTWPRLQVVYDVHGRTRLAERELAHLEGYAGSRPVRIGNGAAGQLQLDVYGEVLDAAFQYVRRGGRLDRMTARMLSGLGRTVVRSWREPDEGIWEVRGGRRHHTLSRVMCWVALDRLIRLAGAGVTRVDLVDLRRERDAIRAEVEARGYNERLRSYVSVLDGEDVDAALLLLGTHGYADPEGERMRGTVARVYERLGVNELLFRYRDDDGLAGREGAFGICSFWGVESLARSGQVEAAREAFERLLSYGNDVGLFAEEIDPETGAALGNFPQAFTHVGLINAALTLQECDGGGREDVAARGVPIRTGEPP